MASAMPSTGNRYFRNYPLTGHIADMAQTTRMTRLGHGSRRTGANFKTYSITSSARARSEGGMVRPSVFAVSG
jgi:hypothetical protein